MSEPASKRAADQPRAERAPGPLTSFEGQKPTAPEWFNRVLAQSPQRLWPSVADVRIETLVWGCEGAPGLLLLHGNGAHADWWSFIAPFLAQDFRVVAMSWSGMGGSDWRSAYSVDLYIEEALAAASAGGLFASAVKPVVVGHSFGGFPTIALAARHGRELRSVVLLDTPLWSPEQRADRKSMRDPSRERRPHRIYPTLVDALARFRLAPEQPCEHLYIVDYIARQSIREVTPDSANPNGGFTWRFDPFLWNHYEQSDASADLRGAQCPVAVIWGAQSQLMPTRVIDYMRSLAAAGTAFVEIPEANHHVMLDQPLATVAVLHGLLARG